LNLQWSVAAVVLGVAAGLDVAAAVWVWRRRGAVGRRSLALLLGSAAVWCLSYSLELVVTGHAAQEFWGSLEYVGTTLLPVGWLAFVLEYTGRSDQLSRRLMAVLAIEPIAVWTLLVIPATHHLIRNIPPEPRTWPPTVELGAAYWVHFAYTNALVGIGTAILVSRLLRVSSFYRRQSVLLLAAVVLPLLGNLASSVGLPLARDYDPTPVAVTLGALLLVWGVFRYRLLDLVPVARSLMFDRLGDPVLVVDAYGRVVDGNPAADAVLGASAGIGRPVRDLLREQDVELLDATPSGPEIRLTRGPEVQEYEMIASELRDDRGRHVGQLVHLRDISARKQAERRLRWLADYDQLTRLPNRRLLTDRLEQAIARARRSRGRCALLLVDLDRFKLINDSLGHPAGDQVLARVGNRLRVGRRTEDTAARIGGDEFAVLLPEISERDDATLVAHRVLDLLAEPMHLGNRELVVTASIGVAVWPDDGDDAQELFSRADAAMYRAKEHGRHRAESAEGTPDATAAERLRLGVELRHALKGDELRVLFQPLVDLHEGNVVGMEALLRWQHPRLGLLQPAAFLHVAEEAGLSADIDRWVLRQACRHGSRWAQAGHEVSVAVNVSANRFGDAPLTLTADVAGVLEETMLPPKMLMLEINERTIIDDPGPVARELGDLRDLGVGVALDDFGAGHTSLTHLRLLPIDMLKIDYGLVHGISSEDSDDGRILSAVTTLAHILGMTVTAEGVERQDQVVALQRAGCNNAQGFLFSPPVGPSEADELVAHVTLAPR
jgi:diguanylate cyclase (GGDEF)-like protein/PAS domain S-box-containing protein